MRVGRAADASPAKPPRRSVVRWWRMRLVAIGIAALVLSGAIWLRPAAVAQAPNEREPQRPAERPRPKDEDRPTPRDVRTLPGHTGTVRVLFGRGGHLA